jgi:hypothetical protein
MATLDVSAYRSASSSPIISTCCAIETISPYGRSTAQIVAATYGTIYPTGENSLQRQADQRYGLKTLTIVTPYRLRSARPAERRTLSSTGAICYRSRSQRLHAVWGGVCRSRLLASNIDAPRNRRKRCTN